MFSLHAAIAPTDAPANVTLLNEQKIKTRFSLPAFFASSIIFNSLSGVFVKWCTQYALSQNILKSADAVVMFARRFTVSSLYV